MAETNWENWYRANPNPSPNAHSPQDSVPDWMSWIDNPLFQDSSSLTPAPPAAGRWSLTEESEEEKSQPSPAPSIESQPSQTPAPDEKTISAPVEAETPPLPNNMQETKPLPTLKPKTPPSPDIAMETQSSPDDAETLQTFVVSSILPLTRRSPKNMKPFAPKEAPNDDAPQAEISQESYEEEPQEQDQLFDDDVTPDTESPTAIADEIEPAESETSDPLPSDVEPQESLEPLEDDIAPTEEPEEQFVEETEEPLVEEPEEVEVIEETEPSTTPFDPQPTEEPAVGTGNTIAFPIQAAPQEETNTSSSPTEKSAAQEKKQKTGFLKKMQSFWERRSQTDQSKESASGQREHTDRTSTPTRPVNPDRPHKDRPRGDSKYRSDRPRPVEPIRQESAGALRAVRNDRLVMQERKETERLLSKEREKKERARERERQNRKKREEERRLEMERIQTADPRDPSFRRTLSESDIFGGAEAEYMYAFSSQRHRQDTQGRTMERSRTGSQPERQNNYSATRSRDGQRVSSNAPPRSSDAPRTGQPTRRIGQAPSTSNTSATRSRRRKGPNYRLILCVIMLIAIVLDFVFLGMFIFQRSQATGLNGQIETLTKDKETLTTQVSTLTQENATLEANMMSALPEPTTARTDNLPDLIPQLTDGIYIIHVSEGYQYLKVPDGYLTDKINTFGNAAGYTATNTDPPTCSYYVLYANKVVGLAEGDTGLVSEDRTATGAGSSLPTGFYAFVASFFNH